MPSESPLPPFTVRESPRARRVRLRVTAEEGLVVIVPCRFPRSRVSVLVRERRAWAERALAQTQAHLARRRSESGDAGPDTVPDVVRLQALGEELQVVLRPSASTSVRAIERDGRLILSGAVGDVGECRAALRRWLARRAAPGLTALAAAVASEHGFAPSGVGVRGQRGRWGSCSRRGHVTLNRMLLFLPRPLAEHVVLHEMCHLERMDHSPAFHALLAEHDPTATDRRRELRDAWRHVPEWATERGPQAGLRHQLRSYP